MDKLAVIPECYVDTCLTETITSTTGFNHQKGCTTVCKVMKEKFFDRFALGVLDKDKRTPSYLNEFDLIGSKKSIHLYKHPQRHHYIIQLEPAIEEVILKAAIEKNIRMVDFGLPDNKVDLMKITKSQTSKKSSKFSRLFTELADTSDFKTLSDLIKYLATNKYNCQREYLESVLQ